ncbi:MAG: hypothetical protein RL685_4455 [Pseudomonadota bacterium]|jgi:hypothetical protein
MTSSPPEEPNGQYLDRLMRRESFAALWPLFAKATRPAKELTESYSALEHLRPYLPESGPYRVLHVGDGAHARTAALFALKTQAENISIDPVLNHALVQEWCSSFGIRRLSWHKARIAEVAEQLNALPEMPVLVTFVHAHLHVDEVLEQLRWDVAFTLACCVPGHQLSSRHVPRKAGEDRSVLSEGRQYQVLVNTQRPPLRQGRREDGRAGAARGQPEASPSHSSPSHCESSTSSPNGSER